ncbi:hypothetical protein [Pseudomonas palleroniana]|uniref:hypothetical protein n=1 Tax=Pseudomonas palleroniana TaxID=191390 RepID=UPI0018E669CF|nr:hypothetical protein [Pseudomonas palleroniana]MBI6907690.1 hypothetical protein [Pseudomonas palleroniana]
MKSRLIYKVETLIEEGDTLQATLKNGQMISGKLMSADEADGGAFVVMGDNGRPKAVSINDLETVKVNEVDGHPYYYHSVRVVPIAAALTGIVCTAVIGAIGTVVRCAMEEYHKTGGWHPK